MLQVDSRQIGRLAELVKTSKSGVPADDLLNTMNEHPAEARIARTYGASFSASGRLP